MSHINSYHMKNPVLNTTSLAFKAHNPTWHDRLMAGTKQLSRDEAEPGIVTNDTALVTMGPDELAEMLAALKAIEEKVGTNTIFSLWPIGVAVKAWTQLLEEMRRGTIPK